MKTFMEEINLPINYKNDSLQDTYFGKSSCTLNVAVSEQTNVITCHDRSLSNCHLLTWIRNHLCL